eukprot:jgi/Botrbrau1/7225/Bobra.0021s0010.1
MEAKPKQESEVIQLAVKDQNGTEVQFKVKMSTKFEKIMNAYAQKKTIEATTIRFLFEGQRLNPAATPAEVGMTDHDVIDCVLEQIGGSSFEGKSP